MSASVTDGAMVTFCKQRVLSRLFVEGQRRRPQHNLVALAQQVLVHPLAVQKRPVQAAEVPEEKAAVGLAQHLRVLLGDDPIENLQRVVGVTADGVDRGELVLAPLVAYR